MNDPTLGVTKREERGLNVADITGVRKGNPNQSMERAAPIRPRVQEYDIINPTTGDNRLRMSSYGKNVLSSRQAKRSSVITGSPPAGKKHLPKQGEASMDMIWPADEGLRQGFNERNRGLESNDINVTKDNARIMKLRQADNERIRAFLAANSRNNERTTKPYKNASNVFTHLVDDPTTRQKPLGSRNSCRYYFLS